MIRDKYNIIPMIMAALLHGLFISSLLVVFDFSRPITAASPLVLQAELVVEQDLKPAPAPVVLPPEPEPEPEPPPDNTAQERAKAEEQKRQEEVVKEQQRITAEREAERKKKAAADAERKKREEAELERKKAEVEKKRLEEVERQRKENERLRKEAMAAEESERRQQEINEEAARLAAMNSPAMGRYQMAIQQKVMRNWVPPASATTGIECKVAVRQAPGGEVISALVQSCNGDDAVRRSIEAAIFRASPLPDPEDPNIFLKSFTLNFKPEQ